MIRLATATYPLDWFDGWQAYEAKMAQWVSGAASNGAQILMFPEYGAMELASLSAAGPADLIATTNAVCDALSRAHAVLSDLAAAHGVYILAPSGPTKVEGKLVNRAAFLSPTGAIGFQDKQIMTPWEADPWGVAGCAPLAVFETIHGNIGVLICYDSEFPLLGRALMEENVDLILVPSATETRAGYHRVRIGAAARALEGQCFTAMSSIVGTFPLEAVDENHGAGGIFCPPDIGLPETGVIALGDLDVPGWVYGDLDYSLLDKVRRKGGVRNRADWPLSAQPKVTRIALG